MRILIPAPIGRISFGEISFKRSRKEALDGGLSFITVYRFIMLMTNLLQCLLIPSRLIPAYYFRVVLSFNEIYRPKIALFCLTVDFLSLLFLDLYGRS